MSSRSFRTATTDATFRKAAACLQRGKVRDAEHMYQSILGSDPHHFGALHDLGLIRLQQKQFREAANFLNNAVGVDPSSAVAHYNLGVALKAIGGADKAIAHFEIALTLKPNLAEAHNNIGTILESQKRSRDAIAHFEKAIQVSPGMIEAHYNLGTALAGAGRYEDAIALYETVIALNPQLSRARNNLGAIYNRLDRHQDALGQLEEALAINPRMADAHNNLGIALKGLDRHNEALAHFELAATIEPAHAEAFANAGGTLTALGALERATHMYERAIALDPKRPVFYRGLAAHRRFTATDPYLAAMEKLAGEMSALPYDEQIELHFALGKALADIGRHEQSFDHLSQGNALKRRKIVYDEAATLELFNRFRSAYTADAIRAKEGAGDPSTLPIFIFGMPRSGSTLLSEILGSHHAVFSEGEVDRFQKAFREIENDNVTSIILPESLKDLGSDRLDFIGSRYIAMLKALAPDAERIVNKMLGNFYFAGLIHLVLPNARMIHIRRDPVDTCVSCFSTLFTDDLPFTYDLHDLSNYYHHYQLLMEHWKAVLPDGAILEVAYEDLVADLEGQTRRILAHCGLDWDPACLNFHKAEGVVRTASATQVRQPLYNSSVGRWKPYGHLLGPLLAGLELPPAP